MRLLSTAAVCASLFLGFQVPAFAKAVPQSQLDHVNQFLMSLVHLNNGASWGVTSAEEDDQGVVRELELVFEKHEFNVETKAIGAFTDSWHLNIALNDDAEIRLSGHTKEHMELVSSSVLAEMRKTHKDVEKAGVYELESNLHVHNGAEATAVEVALKPKSPETASIKIMHATMKSDPDTKLNMVEAFAILNSKSDLVARGRNAMTKMFNDLRASKTPSNEDYTEFLMVYGQVLVNFKAAMDQADATPSSDHQDL